MLPFVAKPGRYIGNEFNIVRKSPADVDLRIALVFPDVYEIGMSYLGFAILYHLLNRMPGVYAERVFAPWIDMEQKMREQKVPLFSLETRTPLNQFDIVGFTLQYELHFPTILNLLDLGGVPLSAWEREGFPLVFAGGPSAFNPEPIAEFLDAVVIGDGEEIAPKIAEMVRVAKRGKVSRADLLFELAKVPGVYVPQFYREAYDETGKFRALEPVREGVPRRIRAQIVEELKPEYYPDKPLVPLIPTAHDRVSLEIARGCSRGCRFCNAGIIYRPVRERSPEDLLEQARRNIEATGHQEVSLLSLSTSDYTQLPKLMYLLAAEFSSRNINISFPSLKPESFTPLVARYARGVRKSGLTLAPEAGSQRLRNVINKATSEGELLRAVELAFREGWETVKLYFMIGHPTETDADLEGLIDLVDQVRRIAAKKGGRIHVSLSPFIPKPHTPFQWAAQDTREQSQRKLDFLLERMRWRNVKVSRRDPETAYAEGLLARGDRRLAKVIRRVWELGAKLDGWTELFDFSRYETALKENGLEFAEYLAERSFDDPLPWDHIDKGVTKKFLRDEYRRALGEEQLPDCRLSECHACGLMGQKVCRELFADSAPKPQQNEEAPIWEPPAKIERPSDEKVLYARLRYSRDEELRWLSHLDMMRLIEMALRRSKLPVVFTQGFNPHPKLAYGPPLPTGLTSEAEYLDIAFTGSEETDFINALSPFLPNGMRILQQRILDHRPPAPAAVINRAVYDFFLTNGKECEPAVERLGQLLSCSELRVERKKESGYQIIDIRPFLLAFELNEGGFALTTAFVDGKSARIDEILALVFPHAEEPAASASIHRRALWVQNGDRRIDPMDLTQ
ncbi:MAG: TIGR03960 family B12-binding radical SAM protein [candidate division KSB1 bacterium]|nr:TIGR03960 family B12-binding radical SAM protein [candidate division KSB1 bacterium]